VFIGDERNLRPQSPLEVRASVLRLRSTHKPEAYANIAAETWFEARTLIEQRRVILPNDRELIPQLSSRRGWPDSKGRLVLEPKSDLRSRNLPSPDRADAVLGAMTTLNLLAEQSRWIASLPDPDPALMAERLVFTHDRLSPEDF